MTWLIVSGITFVLVEIRPFIGFLVAQRIQLRASFSICLSINIVLGQFFHANNALDQSSEVSLIQLHLKPKEFQIFSGIKIQPIDSVRD